MWFLTPEGAQALGLGAVLMAIVQATIGGIRLMWKAREDTYVSPQDRMRAAMASRDYWREHAADARYQAIHAGIDLDPIRPQDDPYPPKRRRKDPDEPQW